MKRTLFSVAKKYIEIIEEIENTSDPEKLQNLEDNELNIMGYLLIF